MNINNNCIFCSWGKERGGENIWENSLFISRLDSFPVSPGHALIIPRRHVVDIQSLEPEEWRVMQQAVQGVIEVLAKMDLVSVYQNMVEHPMSELSAWFCDRALQNPRINTKPDAHNHGVNDGRAAGRTVDHLHWHVIPRYIGDMKDPRGGVRYVIPNLGNYKIPR